MDRSSVTRWLHRNDAPDADNEERITALRYVMTRLLKFFKEEAAIAWLEGRNAHLGDQRPLPVPLTKLLGRGTLAAGVAIELHSKSPEDSRKYPMTSLSSSIRYQL